MLKIKHWGPTGFLVLALLLIAPPLMMAAPARAQGYGIGTPVEAKRMVEHAVDFLRANGEDKALQEFNKRNGKFQWRDLYVFAYDQQGVMRGHPNPDLIGKNMLDHPDINGKLFRKDIIEIASVRGSAWVDYTYINPRTRQEETKITFCAKEAALILCCGAYLP